MKKNYLKPAMDIAMLQQDNLLITSGEYKPGTPNPEGDAAKGNNQEPSFWEDEENPGSPIW